MKTKNRGFTIVELLVVIVVIGILAAITIVSYTGITNKATQASLQSDLSNSSKLLKMYYTDYGIYPVIANGSNCPSNPVVDNKYCLKPSSSNTLTYSPNSGTTGSSAFTLSATNNTTTYTTTNNSAVISPAPLSPVADWLALPQGDHYGNYYDLVTKSWATVTRAASTGAPTGTTGKTIYDPNTQKIYDVPENKLAINPRSDGKSGSEAVIEEGRTNYLSYSSISSDINNDGLSDAFAVTAKTLLGTPIYSMMANGIYGNYQRVQYTTQPSDSGYMQLFFAPTAAGSFSQGDTVTFSMYIKGSGAQGTYEIDALDSSGNYITAFYGVTESSYPSWTRFVYTFSSLPANTSRLMH